MDLTVDRLIMKYVGIRSPREIAEMTGLTPEAVLRRKNELLEEVDVLTVEQKQQKLVMELQDIAVTARETFNRVDDEYKAGMLQTSVQALKELNRHLTELQSRESVAVQQLNELRVRELVTLMRAVVGVGAARIAAKYQVDEDEVLELFSGLMTEQAERLEIV